MERTSLSSGDWQFREAPRGIWRTAVVPGCVHRDLLTHALIPDPFWADNERLVQWVGETAWEYRTQFSASPGTLAHEEIDLVADGLDTIATLYLNDRKIGTSENMFTGQRWSVKKYMRAGSNDLRIHFASAATYVREHRTKHVPREINDPIGGCTRIRKQQCQFGWDWAPRLITAGIWRDLRVESWTENRFVSVRLEQQHKVGRVRLRIEAELARKDPTLEFAITVMRGSRTVARAATLTVDVPHPELWWPNGQGDQPLYDVVVEVHRAGVVLDRWSRRIGLRTIELRRQRDAVGESFEFVVNSRPLFAKGASWIPAHSFVAGLGRKDFLPLLTSAARAHMNMIRVWGGGVYEDEEFYDVCDELGLLVWQDFMFACTLYPGDVAFRNLVSAEAEFQVQRLRHRACLALWCGNNELELLNADDLASPAKRRAYKRIFAELLPKIVARSDGVTAYWRSSPSQATAKTSPDPDRSGNAHVWDVWHTRHPVERYEERQPRFVSEFGMQSFPSQELARTFCPPGQMNVFSRVMEAHQKNPAGNQIILDYVSRRYRFPKNYAALAHVSQLNQAHCIRVAVEHYRRSRPRTMGALYWQLNDCWPVTSWSSLEFNGQWKPLHYAARRFFAPLLVSARVQGREQTGIGNLVASTVSGVELHTVSDLPAKARGRLRWQLCTLDGRSVRDGQRKLTVEPGGARCQVKLDFAREFRRDGRDIYYLRYDLTVDRRIVYEETVLFTTPRAMELPRGKAEVKIKLISECCAAVQLSSPVWLHRCWLDFSDCPHWADDNAFDLFPGEGREIRVDFPRPVTVGLLERRVRVVSLADLYE